MHQRTRTLARNAAALLLMSALTISSAAPLALADEATTTPIVSDAATTTAPIATDSGASDPNLNASTTAAVATSTEGTGGLSAASSTGDAVIVTGDASASTTAITDLNTSSANDVDSPGKTQSSSITASTTDEATTTLADETTAATGDNTASSTGGLATIITGVAQATANVINEVNTNIFNSAGLILFLNQLFGGGFNLNFYDLSYFFAGGPGNSPSVNPDTGAAQCTLLTCLNSSALNVLNTNDATITNDVIVRSSTGNNQASSTGDANIGTGSAYAAANVVNLVNTNIVNSSYLLLSFNNFGDLSEDITLPGADFFSKLFASGQASSSINASAIALSGTSTAGFLGTTTAAASTGNNIATTTSPLDTLSASSTSTTGDFAGGATTTESGATATTTGEGAVASGDAYSAASTYNILNHTGVGGTSVFMLFRVAGDWTGRIVGLPAGLIANTIADGATNLIEIMSEDATTTPEAAQLLQYFNASQYNVMSTSTASIANNIDVGADTGSNQATSSEGLASIGTGNAYAAANVVNLVNTNIIGQNWIFALFNEFGNMSGDIVFSDGAPQLSVSASAAPAQAAPGGSVAYTFAVTNEGDADATNVTLNATFDNTLLSFGAPASTTLTGAAWNLGAIAKGSSRTFTYTAQVGSNFPAGQTALVPLSVAAVNNVITAPATSATAEADISVSAPGSASTGGGGGGGGPIGVYGGGGGAGIPATAAPQITITKTSDVSTTSAPATVTYKVSVTDPHDAGPLYGAQLRDTLYAPDGTSMFDKSWSLDTVNPGDLINLSYSVGFSASTTPGTYKNVSTVSGMAYHPYAGSATSTSAASYLTFTPQGEVLGEATGTPEVPDAAPADASLCALRLTGYLARGLANSESEVMKLQAFLDITGSAGVPVTGWFGPMTASAVSDFQRRYAGEVLAPLGLSEPTGGVYGMTLRKINELACH